VDLVPPELEMSDVGLKHLAQIQSPFRSCDYDDASPQVAMRLKVRRGLFPPRA